MLELLAPAVHRLSAQHLSDNRQAAPADWLTDVDTVISAYPTWHETCNLVGVGSLWIVEIPPDPYSQTGYLSIPKNYKSHFSSTFIMSCKMQHMYTCQNQRHLSHVSSIILIVWSESQKLKWNMFKLWQSLAITHSLRRNHR